MTTALDAKLVPAAKKLLDKFGKLATLKRQPITTAYNPVTLEEVRGTEQTQQVRVTPPENRVTKWVDGQLTQFDEGRAYVSPVGLAWPPEKGHRLTLDGIDLQVLRVNTIYSGDDIVLYELGLEAR